MLNITKGVYFITGIDTDAGKTYATAYIANAVKQSGMSVITQKMIQTGCDPSEISEDIVSHRRLQKIAFFPEDLDHTTCPIIYRLPSSPHLAAREENSVVDLSKIEQSTAILSQRYDVVLIEGAGGIMVPLQEDYSTADYIVDHAHPVILVSSARLGSLNHTLLTLEYCKARRINIMAVLYNLYPQTEPLIERDTAQMIQKYLSHHFIHADFIEMPIW